MLFCVRVRNFRRFSFWANSTTEKSHLVLNSVAFGFADYKFTRVGRGVFINFGCTFLDRGGITLEDGVFIGPGVLLVTENHPEQPAVRRNVYAKPIVVGHGVWIGAGAVILPGVTIGEHAVVGAGAIVTKDVPAGVIVAGNPARIVRSIKTE